jgi:glycosyltransferase involved in cell wall biosynthesis
MAGFYPTLDIFVLPSRTTKTWKEQFGRVLIEAMACETAVVGSSSGEIPHVIGDAGLIFEQGNVQHLREQITRLISRPSDRRRLGQTGRLRVLNQYSMGHVAEKTVALYERMLA